MDENEYQKMIIRLTAIANDVNFEFPITEKAREFARVFVKEVHIFNNIEGTHLLATQKTIDLLWKLANPPKKFFEDYKDNPDDFYDNIFIASFTNGNLDVEFPETLDFKVVPVLRGWKKIKHVFKIAKENNAVICGGYVRYMASEDPETTPAGDVDVFPQDDESTEKCLKEFRKLGYKVKHENDMSYTLTSPNRYATNPVVQIIKPVKEGAVVAVGELKEILENFDFTVVRVGLIDKYNVLADVDFIEDENQKKLRIKNIHCPVSSLIRVCKYGRKGYWIRPSECIKLFKDWDERNPEYKERMIALFKQDSLSQKEIDELESLLRID